MAPKQWRRQLTRVALPALGFVVVAGAATAAVVHDAEIAPVSAAAAAPASKPDSTDIIGSALAEEPEITRSADRPQLADAAAADPDIDGTLVVLKDGVEVHADSEGKSPVLATLDEGDRVDVTGRTKGGWTEIVRKDLPRWVRSKEVAKNLPLGKAPCAAGSGVEGGLQPDTVKVYRAVCARFPQITRYGGTAGRGEHATGQALDIMVSSDLGNEIAAFLQENRAKLGVEYLIWRQRIWRPATSASWRGMSSRGSATANHMDHVHVTTYGNAATE